HRHGLHRLEQPGGRRSATPRVGQSLRVPRTRRGRVPRHLDPDSRGFAPRREDAMTAASAALSPTLGLILLALFSALWIGLGWYWGRDAKTFEDYSVAGRNVGMALATATAMATWVTSNTTMVAPQLAYQ